MTDKIIENFNHLRTNLITKDRRFGVTIRFPNT